MPKTSKTTKPPTADELADMVDRGESLKRYFPGKGEMIRNVQRVNVDFSSKMLSELDREASELNISRQAVIKTLVRQALDQRYLAHTKITA